jgi:ankyrin repeat protein
VKQRNFGILAAAAFAVASTPAPGQVAGYDGYHFVDAVRKRDGDTATQLLSSHPTGLVNAKDAEGQSGLLVAISRNDEQWTGFLLNKGADPNLAGKDGDTPLIAASRIGFETAIGWLLGLGARVDTANRMGETPLIIAVQAREPKIAELLLNAGANPDRTDSAAGYSARDYAKRDPRARDILKMIEAKKPKPAAASN